MDIPEPRTVATLTGHRDAELALLRAARAGRLAHAWLIAGPAGIGKATLAFRFARWLLAGLPETSGETLDVPAASQTFRLVAAGSHPDLLTLERGKSESTGKRRTEIVVDDARSVGSFLRLTPALSPWRVVVVDVADEMNPNAANALLKLLEEPPAKAVLLLVSHRPERLLPTLRSRCRRLTLRPLPEADVMAALAAADVPEADRALLARLAEGSPGRALALAGQGGPALYREVAGLMADLPAVDVAAVHGLGDRAARGGAEDSFRLVLETVRGILERSIRRGRTGEGTAPAPLADPPAIARSAARRLDPWVEVWEKVARLERAAEPLRMDRKLVVIDVFTALADAARAADRTAAAR